MGPQAGKVKSSSFLGPMSSHRFPLHQGPVAFAKKVKVLDRLMVHVHGARANGANESVSQVVQTPGGMSSALSFQCTVIESMWASPETIKHIHT